MDFQVSRPRISSQGERDDDLNVSRLYITRRSQTPGRESTEQEEHAEKEADEDKRRKKTMEIDDGATPVTEIKEMPVARRARESPWTAVPMPHAFRLIEQHMPCGVTKTVPAVLAKTGQVLASRVYAQASVPEFPTSVKDGYAVIASDPSEIRRVRGAVVAGGEEGAAAATTIEENIPDPDPLQPGECIRICTGAVLPLGADAVIMVEQTALVRDDGEEELEIRILQPVKEGQDVRSPGSDMRAGDILLEANTVLGSAEIGVLASNAPREIEVFRRPRVCVMSTGNEIVDCHSEQPLKRGQTRDSNRPQLMALFNGYGFKAIDAGIIPDNRLALVEGIRVALRFANVLVTTGGVSMGEKDLMKSVLAENFGFKIHFGRVWMKPGLPATFATGIFEGIPCAVFALPGNPVSSWVCAELFAVPALRRLAGHPKPYQTVIKCRLANALRLDRRPEYVRGRMEQPEEDEEEKKPEEVKDGAVKSSSEMDSDSGGKIKNLKREELLLLPLVRATGSQCSSRLMSLAGANLLLRLPERTEQRDRLEAGEVVDALVVGNI